MPDTIQSLVEQIQAKHPKATWGNIFGYLAEYYGGKWAPDAMDSLHTIDDNKIIDGLRGLLNNTLEFSRDTEKPWWFE